MILDFFIDLELVELLLGVLSYFQIDGNSRLNLGQLEFGLDVGWDLQAARYYYLVLFDLPGVPVLDAHLWCFVLVHMLANYIFARYALVKQLLLLLFDSAASSLLLLFYGLSVDYIIITCEHILWLSFVFISLAARFSRPALATEQLFQISVLLGTELPVMQVRNGRAPALDRRGLLVAYLCLAALDLQRLPHPDMLVVVQLNVPLVNQLVLHIIVYQIIYFLYYNFI